MVLQNCRECTDYWLKNGRNMYGYRFLSRDLHIPEAHPVDQLQPPDPLSIPPLSKPEEIKSAEAHPEAHPPPPSSSSIPPPLSKPEEITSDFVPYFQPASAYIYIKSAEAEAHPPPSSSSIPPQKPPRSGPPPPPEPPRRTSAEAHPEAHPPPPSSSSIPPQKPPRSDPPPEPPRIISCQSGFVKYCGELSNFSCAFAVGDDDDDRLPHPRFTTPLASSNSFKLDDEEDENDDDDQLLSGGKTSFHDCQDNGESPHEIGVYDNLNENEMETTNTSWYFPLYKSAMDGNWDTAKSIYDLHGQLVVLRSKIRSHSETALHVAIGSGHRTKIFVQNMLHLISSQEDLELKTRDGSTYLGIAAKVGNVEAAKLLVEKHSTLLYIEDKYEKYPIHNAAEHGHREMLLYLLQVTRKGQNPDPYDPEGRGPELLRLIIRAELYDAALLLLKLMPKLATSGMESNLGLIILAENPSAFSCWRNEGLFLPIIYTCVPNLRQNRSHPRIRQAHDVENADSREYSSDKFPYFFRRYIFSRLQRIHFLIWTLFERIVPLMNQIKHQKLKGYHAKKLVKRLCREAANNLQKSSDAALLFKLPLLLAAENGIYEIVKEITYSFPDAIWYTDDDNSEVFRLAIKNRHHEVYNLLHEMGDLYVNIVRQSVEDGDNVLHLVAYLAPDDRLRVVSGAALQMQRELQWFKEIESLVQPAYKTKRNKQGKTPQEIFTETHQNLMKEGEKWMRDTSSSCTVAATLIATIVFAAAITVPGGNNSENGKPMLSSEKALLIFGVADALSLFNSCVSILMFLSILTSRYAEGDFVRALPTRLIVGLLTLFLSVASMLAAFSATLYLMFGDRRRWIVGFVIGPSCLIVAVFASMQFSLLVEMIKSTYRSSIFKRSWTNKKAMKCIKKSESYKKSS